MSRGCHLVTNGSATLSLGLHICMMSIATYWVSMMGTGEEYKARPTCVAQVLRMLALVPIGTWGWRLLRS